VQLEVLLANELLFDFAVNHDFAGLRTVAAENAFADATVMAAETPVEFLVARHAERRLFVRNPLSVFFVQLRTFCGLDFYYLGLLICRHHSGDVFVDEFHGELLCFVCLILLCRLFSLAAWVRGGELHC
jgi:hypothetical protein